ncbi:MAG: alginate lyase family protein [Acidobacteriota bacterium]
MSILRRIKRALRGDVEPKTIALEAIRRSQVSIQHRRERATLAHPASGKARLSPEFAAMADADLFDHFRRRRQPQFLTGFSELSSSADLQQQLFPEETRELVRGARRITSEHCWPLLGLGDRCFGSPVDWHRDPLSGATWPLDFHADINLRRNDGSDVRIVWELNRLPQLLTLARAFAVTNDEAFSVEFFEQVESWRSGNPLGHGVNWNCAMEVALRAMNLLGAFEVFRTSHHLNENTLRDLLAIFDQHGTFIRQHLEFSYIVTSNHYLSDVAGLLWLGIMLPELDEAASWREFGLQELLSEMDKQVLDDGADFESATGYHRFVLELFLYSFILCQANGIEIEKRYWEKLRRMVAYVAAYLRPDGFAPMIGDSDSGQAFPLTRYSGDDHAYILAVGAAVFADSRFKTPGLTLSPEVLWTLGQKGVDEFQKLNGTPVVSQSLPHAGTHIQRDGDLYLLLNTSGAGINGRGSHGHNDALSIEVSACGRSFITDPGTFVYTADLQQRHLFRSTAYHSTVEIDGLDQNTTEEQAPFVIGNEAQPRLLNWEASPTVDRVVAEHRGYTRLNPPVLHRRSVEFDKQRRFWLLEDSFDTGVGGHTYRFYFHFAPGLELNARPDNILQAWDKLTGARLYIASLDLNSQPVLGETFTSRDYGAMVPSILACWMERRELLFSTRWMIVPVGPFDDESERLKLITNRPHVDSG